MTQENTFIVNWRRFLQTAAATTSFGSITTGTVSRRKDADFGEVHFVEMGIEYDAEIPQSDEYVVPSLENDEVLGYSIEPEKGRLEVNQFATSNMRAKMRQESRVVRGESYRPFPSQNPSADTAHSLYTKLTDDYRGVQSLSLAEDYRHPVVDISPRDIEIDVSVSGNHETVLPEREKTITLPERTVEVVAERRVDKTVSDIPPEKRADTFWEEFSKPITVQPTVKVRNRGTLSVFDSQ